MEFNHNKLEINNKIINENKKSDEKHDKTKIPENIRW